MKKPTVFRGVMWDDYWEYDAPCVMYYPFKRYRIGGNSSTFDNLVEDVCCDLSMGMKVVRGFCEDELREFKWRGWSTTGFSRRKRAWHIEIKVRWFVDKDGEQTFEIVNRRESAGPFRKRSKSA